MSCTVCGAWRKGEASTFQRPASISAISFRIAIMASQKRSSSALDSDSVGSIISVPGTGKLMGGAAFGVAVEHREMRLQPVGDIVCIEDRDLGGARQAFAAHHQNVDVGNRQDRRRA